MKINILFEHGTDLIPYGCSYIRMLLPLSHPSINDRCTISSGVDFDSSSTDVVLIERLWKPNLTLEMAEELIRKIRKKKKYIIYTLDDNMLDLNTNVNGNRFPTNQQKNIIRLFAKESDGIIVSTTELKERFEKFNNKIEVVNNALDERLIVSPPLTKNNNKLIIGYMGTPSHESDLMMIMPALREILSNFKDKVKLQLVGILANNNVMNLFEGLDVECLDVKNNVEYPKFMKWMSQNISWDIAIAPLEESEFARCKSDIKFLDYSILGIPGVYSNVTAYKSTVEHKETGYLVENNNIDWTNALKEMINNIELRNKLSINCTKYVNSERVLRQSAYRWIDAINNIVGH